VKLPVHVELDAGCCRIPDVVNADVPVHPPATDAASVARSVATLAEISIKSPPLMELLEVKVSPVCPAMVLIPVNNAFHSEAFTVLPTETVETDDSPRPYCNDPVPAKWLSPNGLELLFTNALYSSSKIVSPAVYAILLFNSYHALC
jgi:hypothetical protein